MQNFDINSLLDDIKRRHELKSDYKLSLFLGVTDGSIRNFRHGRSLPDERICGLLADAAGIDPLILAAQVQAKRSKTEEARSLWAMVAERLQMVPQALAAAFFAMIFATAFVADDAYAESATGIQTQESQMYQVDTSYLLKKKFGSRRFDRDTRSQIAQNFRAMYRSLGMDLPACAKYLHVTQRTLHNWESGKHDIPFAAYKLLRLLNRMELPGQAWQGWCFYGGKLISPEGRAFEGKDSNWWGLLLMRARWYDRQRNAVGSGAARVATSTCACTCGVATPAAPVKTSAARVDYKAWALGQWRFPVAQIGATGAYTPPSNTGVNTSNIGMGHTNPSQRGLA